MQNELYTNFILTFPKLANFLVNRDFDIVRTQFADYLITVLKSNQEKPLTDDNRSLPNIYWDFTKYVDEKFPDLKNTIENYPASYFDLCFKGQLFSFIEELISYLDPEDSWYIEPEVLLLVAYELKDTGYSEIFSKIDSLEHDSTKPHDFNSYDDYLNNPDLDKRLDKYGIVFDKTRIKILS